MENKKLHILIVDDDDRIRNLLKEFLLDYDYFVSTAEDTNQAKNRMENIIEAHQVDLIYHAAAYKHVPILEDKNNFIKIRFLF